MEDLMDVDGDCCVFYCTLLPGQELAARREVVETHASAASTRVAEGTTLTAVVRKVKQAAGFATGDKVFGLSLRPPSWVDVTDTDSQKACKNGAVLHFKVLRAAAVASVLSGVSAWTVPVFQASAGVVDWEDAFFDKTGAGTAPDHLLLKLDEYASEWDGGFLWQAPFAAVVQSSGWGKSWGICQLRQHGVFVIYCSFMKPGYTGFPPRSEVAQCFDGQMSEALVCAYLRASLQVLARSDLSPEDWLECQIRRKGEVQNVVGEAIVREQQVVLPEMLKMTALQLKESLETAVATLRARKGSLLREGGVQVVFAFDEVRGLKDFDATFPVFRKGLGHLPVRGRVFVVLADTNVAVSNFAPHWEIDPTGRSRTHGQKLFDSIYLIGKADIFVERSAERLFLASLHPQRLFLNGRPIWGAHYTKSIGAEKNQLDELVRFAAWKLLGGKTVRDVTELAKVDAAAVFMACIGPEVLSRSYLAQDLVAGHMATCVATADERRRIITVHPSEAVLAEAAAFMLHKLKFLKPALHFLAQLLTEGLVLEGVRGELVMRIILLLCMHKCVEGLGTGYYIQAVTLRSFLQTMFGADWDESQCESLYLDAVVCFNHFIPLSGGAAVTNSRVRDFLHHGAAFLYPPGEFAADIGIPWVLLDPHGVERETGILEIQVKNRAKFSSYQANDAWSKLKRRHKKMFPRQSDAPMAIINLGGGNDALEQKKSVTVALGISAEMYPFLEDEVVDALNHVLVAQTDFRAHVPACEVELVKAMAVLSL